MVQGINRAVPQQHGGRRGQVPPGQGVSKKSPDRFGAQPAVGKLIVDVLCIDGEGFQALPLAQGDERLRVRQEGTVADQEIVGAVRGIGQGRRAILGQGIGIAEGAAGCGQLAARRVGSVLELDGA